MTVLDDAVVGLLVGSLDVALLWPFVVIASRREAGAPSVAHAVKQGKLWAGGLGALTMLVPYCVAVEALSNLAYANTTASKDTQNWTQKLMNAPLTSAVIAVGLQPIEKKIVMDSLFQTQRSGKGPFFDVYAYAKRSGTGRLMLSGLIPLWARETIYVCAVTVLNPMMTCENPNASIYQKCVSAFAIGFSAGMISAPLQTLNVMQKDERNYGRSLRSLVFPPAEEGGFSFKRLFFGSGSRSFRTGAAGVLWFMSRHNVAAWSTARNQPTT